MEEHSWAWLMMLKTEHFTLETADGPMTLFAAEPTGTAKGAVVVIQEAFGVTTHIQEVCTWLAENGWYAVTPTLFHRLASQVFSYDDLKPVMPAMTSLTCEGIDADLDATFAHIAARGFELGKTAIIGFCMGGSVTLYAAATRALGAAVTFYGGGLAESRFGMPPGVESAKSLRTPWLGMYGDLDTMIPIDDVERVRENASHTTVPTEVVRYADAHHGFNCDDRPAVFNSAVAADARVRTLNWLSGNISPD